MKTLIRVAILIFVAMLIFGGVEVTGFLSHAWTFVDHVIHGHTPTIKAPSIKLPTISGSGPKVTTS
jgi:hypothetical protein